MTQEEFIEQLRELQRIAPLVDNDKTYSELLERRKKADNPANYSKDGQNNAELFADIIKGEKAAQDELVQQESELEQLMDRLEKAKKDRTKLTLDERRELSSIISQLNITNSLLTAKKISYDKNIDYDAEISKNTNIVDDIKKKLADEKDESKIAEYNIELDKLNKEKEKLELQAKKTKLDKRLELSNTRIEKWNTMITYIEDQIKKQKEIIEKARKNVKDATERVNYYNNLQRNYSGKNIDYVDLIQERALYTRDKNDYLKKMETEYGSKVFSQIINNLITKISNQEITPEEAQSKLKKYVEEHFDKDTIAKIRKERFTDLKEISKEIADKEYEINMLSLKLSDDKNYSNYAYKALILNQIEVKGIEYDEAVEKRKNTLAEIDKNTEEMFKLDSEIKDLEKNKTTLMETREQIHKNINNPLFDMDYKRSLAHQLTLLKEATDKTQTDINRRRQKVSELLEANAKKREQIQKEEEQGLLSKLKSELDAMKAKYGYNESTHTISSDVDEVVKEADTKKLEKLTEELKKLKDKHSVANLDFVDQMIGLANTQVTGLTRGGQSNQPGPGNTTGTQGGPSGNPSGGSNGSNGSNGTGTGSDSGTGNGNGNDNDQDDNTIDTSFLDKLSDYHMDGAALDRLEAEGVYLSSKLDVKPSAKQVLSDKYKSLKKWLQEHSKLAKNKKKVNQVQGQDPDNSIDQENNSKTM